MNETPKHRKIQISRENFEAIQELGRLKQRADRLGNAGFLLILLAILVGGAAVVGFLGWDVGDEMEPEAREAMRYNWSYAMPPLLVAIVLYLIGKFCRSRSEAAQMERSSLADSLGIKDGLGSSNSVILADSIDGQEELRDKDSDQLKAILDSNQLKAILAKHAEWVANPSTGERADLSGADLPGAYLPGADLSGANLSGANLSWANLSSADLSGAKLSGANLSSADLSGAKLSRAYLSGAKLSGANLSGANLFEAYLSKADLSKADLSGANLFRADLTRTDLSGADLSKADLSGASLSGADLSKANLSGANLSGAGLSRTDLSRTDLSGANLSGANLPEGFSRLNN